MPKEQSSAKVASKAGEIMAMAREGGPIKVLEETLIQEMNKTGGGTPDVLEVFARVLRPYIDAAESVAASALTQREKK